MARMTKLLEKAIEKVRELPEEDQDTVAVAVLSMTEETPVTLDDETRVAIREGLEQARRAEFVPDEEIDALWKQHDL
jgi:predicted transcriptional regulator